MAIQIHDIYLDLLLTVESTGITVDTGDPKYKIVVLPWHFIHDIAGLAVTFHDWSVGDFSRLVAILGSAAHLQPLVQE